MTELFRVDVAPAMTYWYATVNGLPLQAVTLGGVELTVRGVLRDDLFGAELVDADGKVHACQYQVYLPRPVGLSTPSAEDLEAMFDEDWDDRP